MKRPVGRSAGLAQGIQKGDPAGRALGVAKPHGHRDGPVGVHRCVQDARDVSLRIANLGIETPRSVRTIHSQPASTVGEKKVALVECGQRIGAEAASEENHLTGLADWATPSPPAASSRHRR